jgi:nitroreductase
MDLIDAIQRQRPCRLFSPKPVPEEALHRVLNATRMSTSAGNQQPWRFIVVRNEDIKGKLAQAFTNGGFLRTAPVVVVALGVEGERPAMVGGYMLSFLLDVAASIQTFILAATAEGLGTCWLTDFKEDRVIELFQLPEGVHVVGMLPLGFPVPEPNGNGAKDTNGRKSLSEIMAFERFSW